MHHLFFRFRCSIKTLVTCTLFSLTTPTVAAESPRLLCKLTYAGITHEITANIIDNPYMAEIHDIGGRFSFKAVLLGSEGKLATIKLYAYRQGRDKDFPIHEAVYFSPFPHSDHSTPASLPLTPINHLYAGEVERELQYQCFLQWEKK